MKFKYKRDPHAIGRLLALTVPFTEEELTALGLPIRLAYSNLQSGTATEHDVSDIIAALNVTSVRSHDVSPEVASVAEAAVYAMDRCVQRFQKLGKWGLDGPGLAEVEQGIELHEQFCRLSTPRQMRDAALLVQQIRKETA